MHRNLLTDTLESALAPQRASEQMRKLLDLQDSARENVMRTVYSRKIRTALAQRIRPNGLDCSKLARGDWLLYWRPRDNKQGEAWRGPARYVGHTPWCVYLDHNGAHVSAHPTAVKLARGTLAPPREPPQCDATHEEYDQRDHDALQSGRPPDDDDPGDSYLGPLHFGGLGPPAPTAGGGRDDAAVADGAHSANPEVAGGVPGATAATPETTAGPDLPEAVGGGLTATATDPAELTAPSPIRHPTEPDEPPQPPDFDYPDPVPPDLAGPPDPRQDGLTPDRRSTDGRTDDRSEERPAAAGGGRNATAAERASDEGTPPRPGRYDEGQPEALPDCLELDPR